MIHVPPPEPTKLVTIGASDIVGVGTSNGAADGWAPQLAKRLPGRVSLMKLGISGASAGEIRRQLLPRAVAARPDVAVLWTGVNDVVWGGQLQAYRRDLDAIVGGLAGTGARVYVVNLPDVTQLPAVRPHAALLGPVLGHWQTAVREVAKAHGAHTVELDVFALELGRHPEYISADGYHPSAVGYKRLAEVIADQVASKL